MMTLSLGEGYASVSGFFLSYEYATNAAYFFFFKQKTAYEISVSDWSSDVCSSDLPQKQMPDTEKYWKQQKRLRL